MWLILLNGINRISSYKYSQRVVVRIVVSFPQRPQPKEDSWSKGRGIWGYSMPRYEPGSTCSVTTPEEVKKVFSLVLCLAG